MPVSRSTSPRSSAATSPSRCADPSAVTVIGTVTGVTVVRCPFHKGSRQFVSAVTHSLSRWTSLQLHAGVLDHLLPIDEIVLLALGELGRRRADRVEAERLPFLERLGSLQGLVDVGRQLVDDWLGRPGG